MMSGNTNQNYKNLNIWNPSEILTVQRFYRALFEQAIQENYTKYLDLQKQLKEKTPKFNEIFQNIPQVLSAPIVFNPALQTAQIEIQNFKNITIPCHVLKLTETLQNKIKESLYSQANIEIYFVQALKNFLWAENLTTPNLPIVTSLTLEEKQEREIYLNLFLSSLKELNSRDDKNLIDQLETFLKPKKIPVQPQQREKNQTNIGNLPTETELAQHQVENGNFFQPKL